MPSEGARYQGLEATIPRDELAICENGETKVAAVVNRAVKSQRQFQCRGDELPGRVGGAETLLHRAVLDRKRA
jgi:hypothetical protein